jgi:hypothetical protein
LPSHGKDISVGFNKATLKRFQNSKSFSKKYNNPLRKKRERQKRRRRMTKREKE